MTGFLKFPNLSFTDNISPGLKFEVRYVLSLLIYLECSQVSYLSLQETSLDPSPKYRNA